MNQMGEGENASGELRVARAPYRGSETVTHMIHGILPARLNWNPPRYQDIRDGAVALLSSLDDARCG
jgi:hypothetical protein